MKTIFVAAGAALAALSLSASVSADAPARAVEASGGFSYVPPPGWTLLPGHGSRYKSYQAGPAGSRAVLRLEDAPASTPLDMGLPPGSTAPQTVYSHGPFVTRFGVHGYRAVFDGPNTKNTFCTVIYMFPAKGKKIMVTALWPPSGYAKYIAATDEAMKTFALK